MIIPPLLLQTLNNNNGDFAGGKRSDDHLLFHDMTGREASEREKSKDSDRVIRCNDTSSYLALRPHCFVSYVL